MGIIKLKEIYKMSRTRSQQSVTTDDGYASDGDSANFDKENAAFRQKYLVEKLLNNSANGVIYTGTRKSDLMPVVVKQIPKSRITQLIESVPPEIYYHRRASDISGVCALLDWYERRTSWVLVLERDQRSVDLFELSSQYGALGEDAARVILRQVLQTSLQLAKNGVFHRDLKDENIMVNTRTLETKLIDFGCATTQHNADYTELIGTPEFFPPEYYTIKCYGAQASTTWTIGILMYVLLVGDIPFDNQHQIVSGKREKHDETSLSGAARELLSRMLSVNPSSRPTLHEIITSEWMIRS